MRRSLERSFGPPTVAGKRYGPLSTATMAARSPMRWPDQRSDVALSRSPASPARPEPRQPSATTSPPYAPNRTQTSIDLRPTIRRSSPTGSAQSPTHGRPQETHARVVLRELVLTQQEHSPQNLSQSRRCHLHVRILGDHALDHLQEAPPIEAPCTSDLRPSDPERLLEILLVSSKNVDVLDQPTVSAYSGEIADTSAADSFSNSTTSRR